VVLYWFGFEQDPNRPAHTVAFEFRLRVFFRKSSEWVYMTKEIKAVLFDLGGVLIELDGPPIRSDWVEGSLSYEQSWQRWGASAVVNAFETGNLSAQAFIKGVIEEQGLNISATEFRRLFSQWPKGLLAGAASILNTLRGAYTVAFYSNTNELHLPRIMNELNLGQYFDFNFASYEIGFFKPDIMGFEYCVNTMGLEPNQVLFVDDNSCNVTGAREAGLVAEQAYGTEELVKILVEYGCLSPNFEERFNSER